MSDVAREADVSVMTVSNVINDRPDRVGSKTKSRVLAAIQRLGYEVNLTARGLRAGRTGTIALIVPRYDHVYFGALAARLALRLEESGLHLVVEQSGASAAGELAALSLARLQMYDGVFLSVVGLSTAEVDRIRSSVPVVLLGEREVPQRFDHVSMDNVNGARMAVNCLLRAGAKRIAIVGGIHESDAPAMGSLRTQGWREAQEATNIPVDPDLLIEVPHADAHHGFEAVSRLLDAGTDVDAIFTVTDELAVGVLSSLYGASKRIPEQVQVMGFDNLAMGQYLVPRLSSVDPDHESMVESMVCLLERRLKPGGATVEPTHTIIPAGLRLRDTTR